MRLFNYLTILSLVMVIASCGSSDDGDPTTEIALGKYSFSKAVQVGKLRSFTKDGEFFDDSYDAANMVDEDEWEDNEDEIINITSTSGGTWGGVPFKLTQADGVLHFNHGFQGLPYPTATKKGNALHFFWYIAQVWDSPTSSFGVSFPGKFNYKEAYQELEAGETLRVLEFELVYTKD
ncbi:hypothetical protein FUAX_50420 (plasmid) [Fulvitalea axinellae]|uniref:Lipoprotein n=1 Tax=Fulvitalea axinellae TaxID=1182444 RepID=A0AAU9DN43_9BACT|nr:hypothetical protein FUAX_50420 [Fulvitalea axinellae]